MLQLCDQHNLAGWTLFPSDDEAAAFLARNHSALSARFRITTPPWNILRWTYDKRLTHSLAAAVGIDQPNTFVAANRGEVAVLNCSFPVILKPAYKTRSNPFTRAKAWRADNREALLCSYDEARRLVDPAIIMIQEYIPGGGTEQFSYAALCIEGCPRVSVTVRRTRQYPRDFGRASSYVESIHAPELEDPSRRLLKSIGLTGLAEVEYKRDPRTGSFLLLDINARVWGWHTLAATAGADFPYFAWQLIHQEPVPELHVRSGVRWVRMLTDLPAAASEIVRGRLSLSGYLNSLRFPMEFAIFAADDLVPAFLDIPYLVCLGLKRKLRSLDEEMPTEEVTVGPDYGGTR
jgi:predicted ATP-grasp superfamily ATP-dependent carboligase